MGIKIDALSGLLKEKHIKYKHWHEDFIKAIMNNNQATVDLYILLYKPTKKELKYFGLS